MLLSWFSVLPSMLASESRMVVHVAVCTIYSRVLGILVINLEDMLDPLDIDNLLIWRELICLCNWTWHGWEGLSLLDLDDLLDPLEQNALSWKNL